MSRGAIVIKINGDATTFENELKKVEKQSETLTKGLTTVGAVASAAFVGLGAAIGYSVAEFREGLKVQQQTEALIASTGGAAGLTAEEINKMAVSFQKVTNYGDEAIQSGQNILLTYKNIKADVFPAVTALSLDMAEKFGGISSAADILGKALNNPEKGLTLLRRAGVVFTQQQQEMVKNMLKAGDVAGAQGVIIEKLQGIYGGFAEKSAEPLTQFKNVIGDLVQEVGAVFYPAIANIASSLKDLSFNLLETNPTIFKMTAYLLGAATAVAGLTAVVTLGAAAYLKVTAIWSAYSASAGIASTASSVLATAIGGIGTALRFMLMNPVGLTITALIALGAAIYTQRDRILSFFAGVSAAFSAFVQALTPISEAISKILEGAFTLDGGKVVEGFTAAKAAVANAGTSVATAYWDAYNAEMAKRSIESFESTKNSVELPTGNGSGEMGTQGGDDYEIEGEKEKKKKKIDLEKEYREELAKIKTEYDQVDLAADEMYALEKAKKDLEEKKQRTLDEQKYGKSMADIKAFWRSQEMQGTTELFGQLSTLTQSNNKDLFRIGKAAAMANAVINTAQGVTRTLAEYPFPLNVALAAAVGVAGAVQIATISGQTLQAKEGYSGSGGPFGESFVSTFQPTEITIPENFSSGIKRGEYALTSAKDQQAAQASEITVHIALKEDAIDVLEVQRVERLRLGVGVG